MTLDLPLVWGLLIAVAVLAYVILDGFDLGVGILYPLLESDADRDVAMNSVAPVWDGNETWLILGGGGLFAAFPLAYAVVMPAVYLPVTVMLLALVFRGVAFEFRWRDPRHRPLWDVAFAAGSTLAAAAQGVILGAVVQGIEVEGRAFAGGAFDWLSPFSLATGASLVVGYGLLGSTWLIWRTEGHLQAQARRLARPMALFVVSAIAGVSLVTPYLDPAYAARWYAMPNLLLLSPVPLLVGWLAWVLLRSLARAGEVVPFLASLGLFALSFVGLGISLFPNIVPPRLTIWDAASADNALAFMLVGAAVLLPIIIAYTAYTYWLFRGKVRPGDGYH
jgi:cytochrome d ubiquinol oxidase subunit II